MHKVNSYPRKHVKRKAPKYSLFTYSSLAFTAFSTTILSSDAKQMLLPYISLPMYCFRFQDFVTRVKQYVLWIFEFDCHIFRWMVCLFFWLFKWSIKCIYSVYLEQDLQIVKIKISTYLATKILFWGIKLLMWTAFVGGTYIWRCVLSFLWWK